MTRHDHHPARRRSLGAAGALALVVTLTLTGCATPPPPAPPARFSPAQVTALRQMGFTHVPCLVQPCVSADDLAQAATSEICENIDLYFHAPRPPLLRDFDNPRLTLTVRAPRLRRVVTVKVEVQRRLLAL